MPFGQDFIHTFSGNKKTLTPVKSNLEDTIEISNKPLKSGKIYVIDPKTGSPTLYIRPSDTQISLIDMLEGPARETDALFSAHCEYQEKHYSHFLHIPKLISALKTELKSWIEKHINFIEKQTTNKKNKKKRHTTDHPRQKRSIRPRWIYVPPGCRNFP